MDYTIEAVHKKRPQSSVCVGGRSVQCGHFADKEEEVLQMRSSALFGAKKLRIFRNLWCVRTDGVVNFSQFCADLFYGRPIQQQAEYLTWLYRKKS